MYIYYFLFFIFFILFIFSYILRRNLDNFFRSLVKKNIQKGNFKKGYFYNFFIQNHNLRKKIQVNIAKFYINNNMIEKAETLLDKPISPIYKAIIIEEIAKYYIFSNNFKKLEKLLDNNLKPQFLNNLYKIVIPHLIKLGKFENYKNKISSDYFVEELACRLMDFYLQEEKLVEAESIYNFYPNCYQKGQNLLKLIKSYKKTGDFEKAKQIINDFNLKEKEYLYLNKFKVAAFSLLGDFEDAMKESLKNSPLLAVEDLGIVLDYVYTYDIKGWDTKLYNEANKLMNTFTDSYQLEHAWIAYANLAILGNRKDKVEEYTQLTFNSILAKKHSYQIFDTAKLFFYLKEYKKQIFLVNTIAQNRINIANENEIKAINIAFWGSLLEKFIQFIAKSEIIIEDPHSLNYESFKSLVDIFYNELDSENHKRILEKLAFEVKGKDDLLTFILEYIKLIKLKIK